MTTINQTKQLAEADTPLLFFQCVLPSGDVQYWSTHSIVFNGNAYSARVLKHNLFDLQLSADDAMDGVSQLSLVLANADSALSELNAVIGFKGTQLTVSFAFADLSNLVITTESTVLFRGIAGDPDEITEESLTLTFTNKLSLQRVPVPEVRIQRSCPWNFPATIDQRTEAKDGGTNGRFSRFYRCGYSADIPGGYGNLNSTGQAFTACDKSRTQCQRRGMFSSDASGNLTSRFGGFEFVPSAVMVRTAGDKTSHLSPLLDNSAKYNDPVPIIYGTGWLKAPVIFARNDGNLTHMEVLIGMGIIQSTQVAAGLLKVVVNDVEIPIGQAGADMTTSGWYNVVSTGDCKGNFNLDFTDSAGKPLGDPYGSMAVLSVVVPNRVSSGKSLPNVEVLLQGMQIDIYNPDGTYQTTAYSNNPAWVILDILSRCGWSTKDLNLATFASAAAFCQELISTTDLNGNPIQIPRYECNLVLTKRQSAAAIVRGIRVASSLMLRYGTTGLLELLPETTIAAQQPKLPDGANSTEPLDSFTKDGVPAPGWPVYEFSDGSAPYSGIARNSKGGSTVTLSSRSIAETSNRLSVEFQDESNEYQQDSLSLVDADDAALIGYEISSQSTALGIANFSQATRVLLRQLDKSTKGNLYIQFQTSFRALKVRPGDVIAVTYLKEGFTRVPFRVIKLSPSLNYELVTILAQIHDDDWYNDNPAILGGAGRQPQTHIQTPRPLIGTVRHPQDTNLAFEYFDFGVQEDIQSLADGTSTHTLSIAFTQPAKPASNSPNLPLLSLSPHYSTTGGTISGGTNLYYAVTAVDTAGDEGTLSFTVHAAVPNGTNTNCVTITNLSFPTGATAANIYRGSTPQMLYRIASNIPLSALASAPGEPLQYTDTGAPPLPIGPPDANFDHANFYYRYEYAGPFIADIFSANTIGWSDMGATNGAYAGRIVRIIEGTGRGQEVQIASNNGTTLTVSPKWSVLPDQTSTFVIADTSWKFAAVSSGSPAQFEVAATTGSVIEISGRGANVNNQEGNPDLCPLTRWTLGGPTADSGVAGLPDFSLAVVGMTAASVAEQNVLTNTAAGNLILYQVGFNDLTNTTSVSSGTLQIFSWNELQTPSAFSLATPVDASGGSVQVINTGSTYSPYLGQVIQVGSELMTVLSVDSNTNTYTVVRAALGSVASTHNTGDAVLHLDSTTVVVPFAPGFFSNKASINYLHVVNMPDMRVCGAEFYVTNSYGNSQTNSLCYTTMPDGGLRTLSGGQVSMQASGYLATQQNAAPPLTIEAPHAVRDIRAALGEAANGYNIAIDVLQNGLEYCSLTIDSGTSTSASIVNGVNLPPLQEAASITMNVSVQPLSNPSGALSPGRDLTVTIRL